MKDLRIFFQRHRSTFLAAGIILGGAVVFWTLLLWPSTMKIARLQSEIAALKGRIAQLMPGTTDPSWVIEQKKGELSRLDNALPQQERISEILKTLSQRATEVGVMVVSIRPQPAQPYPSPESPLRIEGQTCLALPIQMQLESSYRTLGKYLESLTEHFPTVVTVDDLDIQRGEGKVSNLKVSLLITSYLFEAR